ncbi:Transposable element Tcb2 transposase [Anthophora retusa]
MVRGQCLPKYMKEQVVNALQNGESISDVSRRFNIAKQTVYCIQKRFQERGHLENKFKSGRPKKTSIRQDRQIRRLSIADPRRTAVEIHRSLIDTDDLDISVRTVRRRLMSFGLRGRHGVKKPLISKKNRMARLKFAQEHLHWSIEDWSNVLFSDESKFKLFGSVGIQWVRRPKGQRFNVRYQIPTVKHGGGSIMVWGCFSGHGVGPLRQIEGIMKKEQYVEILETNMLPHAREIMDENWIFQHDNDPKHASRAVKNWIRVNNVNVLKWPSQSPDLNPIEHLWEHFKLSIKNEKFVNTAKLYNTLCQKWQNITPAILNNLLKAMPKRMQAVIDSRGYSTKY